MCLPLQGLCTGCASWNKGMPFIPPPCKLPFFLQITIQHPLLGDPRPTPRLGHISLLEVLSTLLSLHSAEQNCQCKKVRNYILSTVEFSSLIGKQM